MKKLKIFLAMLISSLAVFADNCFEDGTIWITIGGPEIPGASQDIRTYYYISGDTLINDVKALKLYKATEPYYLKSEGYLCAIIRTEEDKVWVKKSKESNEWGLLYDFGLKPGEGCNLVWSDFYVDTQEPKSIYVKCTGIRSSERYPGIEEMVIQPYFEEIDGETHPDVYDGIWYKGIGSEESLLTGNAAFKPAGGGSALSEVWYKGVQIFNNNSSSVSTVSAVSKAFTINGRNLSCKQNVSGNIAIYTVDGRCIYIQEASKCNFKFPHSGMFIIRNDAQVTSVMVP